jgi:hypothetical protein
MSGQNGHNGKPDGAERSPLDEVRERIEARQEDEAKSGIVPALEPEPDVDPRKWKRRVEGQPPTLEVLHEGLVAVSEFAEAAIESNIQNAILVRTIAAKVEANATHTAQVDEGLAKLTTAVQAVRRDVQFIKDAVTEMQGPVRQIPAIKELLGEIIARLPEPKPKPKRAKRAKK